jgi:serine/threonine protein kinase
MTEPFTTDQPDVGDVVAGRYRLDALVGQGGMARVYRAHDTVLGRRVALKLFRSGSGEVTDGARAESETRLLASLNHPALVTLHDAVLSEEGPNFLVMEYVPGQTLREQIVRGPLPEREVAAAAADLAEALHTVHDAGVVHRDIKPSNVLTWPSTLPDREFRVKLADFGIAYLVDTTRLTTPGLLVGTAAYLAPEQVRGEPITPAADIYALGLVLIEALTGRRAYPQTSGAEAIVARLATSPEIPSTLSPPWRDLLTAMTATDPLARPLALQVAIAASTLPHASRETSRQAAVELETAQMEPPTRTTRPVPVVRTADTEDPTAATAVLTEPATPAPVRGDPAGDSSSPVAPPAAGATSRRHGRSWALGAGIVAAVLLIAGIAWGVAASQTSSDPAPSLPAVEEPLGGHLRDLMDEVTP